MSLPNGSRLSCGRRWRRAALKRPPESSIPTAARDSRTPRRRAAVSSKRRLGAPPCRASKSQMPTDLGTAPRGTLNRGAGCRPRWMSLHSRVAGSPPERSDELKTGRSGEHGTAGRAHPRTRTRPRKAAMSEASAHNESRFCCGAPLDSNTDAQNRARAVGSKRWLGS